MLHNQPSRPCRSEASAAQLRHTAFLPALGALPQVPELLTDGREPVRLLVVGSAQGIETIVQM